MVTFNLRKIFSYIHNEDGESIAETLVATLIASFALVLLAGIMSTSVKIVTDSKTGMSKYYDSVNQMAIKTKQTPIKVTIQNEAGTLSTYDVNGYMSDEDIKKAVVIYEKENT